jgi:hypothetical protein
VPELYWDVLQFGLWDLTWVEHLVPVLDFSGHKAELGQHQGA